LQCLIKVDEAMPEAGKCEYEGRPDEGRPLQNMAWHDGQYGVARWPKRGRIPNLVPSVEKSFARELYF
jgi:hypothetical protein